MYSQDVGTIFGWKQVNETFDKSAGTWSYDAKPGAAPAPAAGGAGAGAAGGAGGAGAGGAGGARLLSSATTLSDPILLDYE